MKQIKTFISLSTIIVVFSSCSWKKDLKSVYGLQNDTIVSIKNYDREGRIIFDRTTQIIESWDNELLTWITAKEYAGNKQTHEYYAHSNTGLRITVYDYDENGSLKNNYSKFYSSSNRPERNPFAEIYHIKNLDSLKAYLLKTIPDSIPFSNNEKASRGSTEFYKSFTDPHGNLVKEFWTIVDSFETKRTIKKYNGEEKLIYKYNKARWGERIEKFQYNSSGELTDELEIWNPVENRFQRKKHFYSNGLLEKTLFYHDTSLAFKYDYVYDDTLLVKETKTRITESEHFNDRKKIETIEYRYEYFK